MSSFTYRTKDGRRRRCTCYRSECCIECGIYREYTGIKTNYDLIISKNPYELAEWIAKILDHCENKMPYNLCSQSCPLYKCCNDQPSDNIEDWLKSPADKEEKA